jgi:hypothetical protein
MFTRRFKQAFARLCIALLCMQEALAAYACPAFLTDIAEATPVAVHQSHEAAMSGDCEQHAAGNSAGKSMCHQHYAGDQSVGSASLASASTVPTLPLAIVSVLEPAQLSGKRVLPVLLQRNTAPPLAIQFQVLRI